MRAVARELGVSRSVARLALKGRPKPKPQREFREFNGKRYYLDRKGYWRCTARAQGKTYMHRDVWEKANGPIPRGKHIHHVDEDKGNNDLSNLVLLSDWEHQKYHMEHR